MVIKIQARSKEELLGQSTEVKELRVLGAAFDQDPDNWTIQKLIEFQKLKKFGVLSCDHKLEIVLEQLKNLKIESLELQYCNLTTKSLEAIGTLSTLQELEMGDQLLSSQEFSFLSSLPLTSLRVKLRQLGSIEIETLTRLSALQKLILFAEEYTGNSLAPLKKMKSLKQLDLSCKTATDKNKIITQLAQWGLLEEKTFDGCIGDWYETGKESRMREFLSSENELLVLPKGAYLEIFSPEENLVFSGIISYPPDSESHWYQDGIFPILWDTWFINKYKAKLKTLISSPKLTVSVASLVNE